MPFVHGALLLVSLLYGVNYVVVKDVVEAVPTRAWVFQRLLFSSLCLVPIALAAHARQRRQRRDLVRPAPPEATPAELDQTMSRRTIFAWLFLAAMLGVVLNQMLFAMGITLTTPAHSAVINATIPIVVLGLAVLGKQERFTAWKLAAVAVALCGVMILLEVDQFGAAAAPTGSGLPSAPGTPIGVSNPILAGDFLVAMNVLCFSAYLVTMRHIGRVVDPMLATAAMFVAATLLVLPWSWPALTSDAWQALFAPSIWPRALYCIVGSTVLTYVLNNWAVQRVSGSFVALYIYVQPIVATSITMARGDGTPGIRFWLATTMIFGGILLSAIGSAKARNRRRRLARASTASS